MGFVVFLGSVGVLLIRLREAATAASVCRLIMRAACARIEDF